MFRIDQIMTATSFIRYFRKVAEHLSKNSEPLLITQKNGRFIVVMDGELFAGLMSARHFLPTSGDSTESSVSHDLKA